MIGIFTTIVWTYLPAGIANMMGPTAAKLFPNWNYSLDQLLKSKQEIFGPHKTIRGFICGVTAATITFAVQQYLYQYSGDFQKISLIDYSSSTPLIGTILGVSALTGDSIKSYFKRKYSIRPGKPWFPFDQLDWIITTIIVTYPIFFPPLSHIVIAPIFLILLHLLVKYIGYRLHIETTPY